MAGQSSVVGAVEALIVLLVTIMIFFIVEITLGAVFDETAEEFAQIATTIPMSATFTNAVTEILGLFTQIHLVVGILVLATAVWVVRVVIFGADYTRYRKGGMIRKR